MKTLISSPVPDNHIILLRLPMEAMIAVRYAEDDEVRDITHWAADLTLLGLSHSHAQTAGTEAPLAEEVEVARVELIGSSPDDFLGFYLHPNTQVSTEFTWEQLALELSKGVAIQLTAGIAEEAAAADLNNG